MTYPKTRAITAAMLTTRQIYLEMGFRNGDKIRESNSGIIPPFQKPK